MLNYKCFSTANLFPTRYFPLVFLLPLLWGLFFVFRERIEREGKDKLPFSCAGFDSRKKKVTSRFIQSILSIVVVENKRKRSRSVLVCNGQQSIVNRPHCLLALFRVPWFWELEVHFSCRAPLAMALADLHIQLLAPELTRNKRTRKEQSITPRRAIHCLAILKTCARASCAGIPGRGWTHVGFPVVAHSQPGTFPGAVTRAWDLPEDMCIGE